MTVDELKQKVNNGILDLGVTPRFTENSSFHKIIENALYPLIEKLENQETIAPKIVTENNIIQISDKYIESSLGRNIHKSVSLRLKKISENSFNCTAEILKDIPESMSRRIKEIFEITTKIDYEGNIYTNEVYSYARETAKPNNLEGNVTCIKSIYDVDGIMVKKEKKVYSGLGYNADIDYITPQQLLYISSKAFDLQSNISLQYDRHETMTREAFDIAEIHINDQATCNEYVGYALLDDTNGLSNMNPTTDFKLENNEVIEPLTEMEIEEKIDQESDPQIRLGLYKYAAERTQYAYHDGIKEEVLTNATIHV